MKIKSLRKDKIFVPVFNGNKELPENERIIVEIKVLPTVTEAQQYRTFRFSQDAATELVYNDSLMLIRHVGKIKNLEDDDGPIKNGSELAASFNLNLKPLIDEIRTYILEESEVLMQGEN